MNKIAPIAAIERTDGFADRPAQAEAEGGSERMGHRLKQGVALGLGVQDRDSQDGAVGGDQGQEDAQGLVQGRVGLLEKHLGELDQRGDDEDEDHRLEVPEIQGGPGQDVDQIVSGGWGARRWRENRPVFLLAIRHRCPTEGPQSTLSRHSP